MGNNSSHHGGLGHHGSKHNSSFGSSAPGSARSSRQNSKMSLTSENSLSSLSSSSSFGSSGSSSAGAASSSSVDENSALQRRQSSLAATRIQHTDHFKLIARKLDFDMDKPRNGQVACVTFLEEDSAASSALQQSGRKLFAHPVLGTRSFANMKLFQFGGTVCVMSSHGITSKSFEKFHFHTGRWEKLIYEETAGGAAGNTNNNNNAAAGAAAALNQQQPGLAAAAAAAAALGAAAGAAGAQQQQAAAPPPTRTVNVGNVRGDIPSERAWSRSVIVRDRWGNDRLLVFAGYNGVQINDTYEYCFRTNSWRRIDYANSHQAIEPINSCSLVIRGQSTHPSAREGANADLINPFLASLQNQLQGNRAELVASMQDPGFDVDGDAIMSGAAPSPRGGNNRSISSTALEALQMLESDEVYDPKVELIVFGGYHMTHINSLYSFNLLNRQWTKLKSTTYQPHPRSGHTCVMLPQHDRMLMFGGYGNGKFIGQVEEYRFDQQGWFMHDKTTGKAPEPRRGHQMEVLDSDPNIVLVCGGRTESGNYVNDCYLYFYNEQMWIQLDLQFHNPRLSDVPPGRHNAHLLNYRMGRSAATEHCSSTNFLLYAGTNNYQSVMSMHSLSIVDSSYSFKQGLSNALQEAKNGCCQLADAMVYFEEELEQEGITSDDIISATASSQCASTAVDRAEKKSFLVSGERCGFSMRKVGTPFSSSMA